jgi:hypothetical protein
MCLLQATEHTEPLLAWGAEVLKFRGREKGGLAINVTTAGCKRKRAHRADSGSGNVEGALSWYVDYAITRLELSITFLGSRNPCQTSQLRLRVLEFWRSKACAKRS